MTDEDIISKLKEICGGNYHKKIPKNIKHKSQYCWSVSGGKAIQWMMTLWSLLGQRRRLQIESVIEIWKTKRPRILNNIKFETNAQYLKELRKLHKQRSIYASDG